MSKEEALAMICKLNLEQKRKLLTFLRFLEDGRPPQIPDNVKDFPGGD